MKSKTFILFLFLVILIFCSSSENKAKERLDQLGIESRGRREFLHLAGSTALALVLPEFLVTGEKISLNTSLITDEVYLKHNTGEFRPENPRRLKSILSGLEDSNLFPLLQTIAPRKASLEWVDLVHQEDYIGIVKRDVSSGARRLSTRSGNTFKINR